MYHKFDIQHYLPLRCEALCGELVGSGVSFNDIIIQLNGSSRKRFGNDIEKISTPEGDTPGTEKVIVEINRDGIYDTLPEGLFHQPTNSSVNQTIQDKVNNHRKLKEEERDARKFFQPFEQEFMHYGVKAELAGRDLTLDIFRGNTTKELNAIWEIPQTVPKEAANTLARIMPWVYYIKTDKKATLTVLQLLLNKEAAIEEHINIRSNISNSLNTLNDQVLGYTSVLGTQTEEPVLKWVFKIKDIDPGEMFLFTDGQPCFHLLNLFTEIFIPIEVDVQYEYLLKKTIEPNVDNILGYGFIL